ncbi:hypothetical protein FRC16_003251 [Serendipita sp. 398]|nr:hypothetical protein FRC16_003251 [Serendipita sp. 398]
MSYHLRREVASVREGPNYGRPSIHRQPSTNTRYMQMLLDLDSVPSWHNLLVALCAWLLLAGFVIFPGTFTSIQNIDEQGDGIGNIERWILHHVKNLPLLVVAGVCCGLGAIGMVAFWIRWHSNYVWVCNRVFLVRLFSFLYRHTSAENGSV